MHSPNTLLTIVSGQAFRIITRHPLHRDGIRIRHMGAHRTDLWG